MNRWLVVLSVSLLVGLALWNASPLGAQTPTPEPWPTPIVTSEYVIRQEVTYGEGGVMIGLLFVAGVTLLSTLVHVGERVTER